MRDPWRKALAWLAAALLGAVLSLLAFGWAEAIGGLALPLGALGLPMLVFGLAGTGFGLLAGIGERRLRRGVGVLARWTVEQADWAAFRAFDERCAAAQPELHNDFTHRPDATGPIEVVFGARQVLMDGSYHTLRHGALPSLCDLAWLQPEDAPETLHFVLSQPRGRYGGLVWLTLRVPVPRAARAEGVRVFHHYRALLPADLTPAPLRRPGLVAGRGAAAHLLGGAVAVAGWTLGGEGIGPALLIGGLVLAGLAWVVTLVLLGAAYLARRAPVRAPSPPP